jgi:hypothetical protein
MGYGGYNWPIFLDRLAYTTTSTLGILKEHVTTLVDEIVVTMLGDMHHGYLKKGSEAELPNVVFNTFFSLGHALAQTFGILAAHAPTVRVVCVPGNHGRWDQQKKMPTENRHSNFDGFTYALVQALTRDIGNLSWQWNDQPFQEFETKGWMFHASHGDHLRGGDRVLGLPAHAIGRNISITTQLSAKHRLRPPNYYLVGHLHRDTSIPHALGQFLINGSFVGMDAYGVVEGFVPVDPCQRLFLVHPKFGRTAEWPLSLKFAPKGAGSTFFNNMPSNSDFPVE